MVQDHIIILSNVIIIEFVYLLEQMQKVPNKYKINLGGEQPDKPNSAIDLTKSIVISNDEYLNNRSKAKIPQNVNNF